MRHGRLSVAVLAAAAALAIPARSQTIEWKAGVDGLWNIPDNWNPANVPDNGGETASLSVGGTYTVSLDLDPGLGGLSITNPSATFAILDGRILFFLGAAMTNNGHIAINSNAGTFNSQLRFDASAALGGTGDIKLVLGSTDLKDAILSTNQAVLTQGASHTIHGAGAVWAELVNNGTVRADVNGSSLELSMTPKTNNKTMTASGGGDLAFTTIFVSQGPSGFIRAEHASTVTFFNTKVSGGQLRTSGSGLLRAFGHLTLTGVTSTGSVGIFGGSEIIVLGGVLTNSGALTVNSLADTNNCQLLFEESGVIDGTGEVILLLGSDDFQDARVTTNGSTTISIGQGQTIRGSGHLDGDITSNGRLAPGLVADNARIGRFEADGPLTLGGSGNFDVDVAAPDSVDSIKSVGAVNLGGTVTISLLNGFVPDTCLIVPLVTAASVQGEFDSVFGDPGKGRVWRIAYTPTQARAVVTCYPDMAVDCSLDLFDFLAFVNYFNDQDPVADCTGDGAFDLFDFLCFVNAFNAGC